MLRDNVAKFAREFVKPKVKEMDRNNQLDKGVLKAMFENGLMGVEVPTEYGGSGLSFTSSIITIGNITCFSFAQVGDCVCRGISESGSCCISSL